MQLGYKKQTDPLLYITFMPVTCIQKTVYSSSIAFIKEKNISDHKISQDIYMRENWINTLNAILSFLCSHHLIQFNVEIMLINNNQKNVRGLLQAYLFNE